MFSQETETGFFIMKAEIVNAETNLNGKKTRKSPVPTDPDIIFAGALKMNLDARIKLRNDLNESIAKEIEYMESQLNGAKASFK